nr:IS110 family transposase [Neorhizobium galegae]
MDDITTIGLDIAKNVFQLHGVDAQGQVVLRKALRRANMIAFFTKLPPCLIGMEACSTAHHWARTLMELGHEVRLISPAYVKPFVKRHKNDAADAAAICEAVVRPSMRFVSVKSEEQQATLMLHSARELLISQRTALMNALRGHFAELGIVVAQGARNVGDLLLILERMGQGSNEKALPETMRLALQPLATALIGIEAEIAKLDKEILAIHRKDDVSLRLASIPGIGPITASFLSASIPDPGLFKDERGIRRYKRFIAAMEELQDELGALNDLATGSDVLAKHGLADHPARDVVIAHGDKASLIRKAQVSIDGVLDAKRFWR